MTKPLTPEQKRANQVASMLEEFRHIDYGKALGKTQKTLQELARISRANEDGSVRCVCCWKLVVWNGGNCHGGHYIPREITGPTIDPINVWPCCVTCNKWLGGNLGAFRMFLAAEIGLTRLKELEARRREYKKWTLEELVEKRVAWMEEIRHHRKRLN